jgi:hypothetical protein
MAAAARETSLANLLDRSWEAENNMEVLLVDTRVVVAQVNSLDSLLVAC